MTNDQPDARTETVGAGKEDEATIGIIRMHDWWKDRPEGQNQRRSAKISA